jgi:hypothetical protein
MAPMSSPARGPKRGPENDAFVEAEHMTKRQRPEQTSPAATTAGGALAVQAPSPASTALSSSRHLNMREKAPLVPSSQSQKRAAVLRRDCGTERGADEPTALTKRVSCCFNLQGSGMHCPSVLVCDPSCFCQACTPVPLFSPHCHNTARPVRHPATSTAVAKQRRASSAASHSSLPPLSPRGAACPGQWGSIPRCGSSGGRWGSDSTMAGTACNCRCRSPQKTMRRPSRCDGMAGF